MRLRFRRLRFRYRSDRGAIAIMVALMSVMLLTLSAMSVDLGQAWAQKKQIQARSDLAAEAGAGIKGANLPASGNVHSCGYGNAGALATDPAVLTIAQYLASQQYPNGSNPGGYSAMVSALPGQLTDCDMSNGEVVYGTPVLTGNTWSVTYNKNQLSLVSPSSHVTFGLAGIIGFNSTDVNGVSTVEIQSPKFSALPFYAFTGCDYGPQTLQQPNNGQSVSTVNLDSMTQPSPASSNTATLATVTPSSYPVDNSPTLEPITITGTNLTGVTQIGFFESGPTPPAPVTSTNFTVNSATQITMPDIPSQARGVAGVQEFWYIRVMKNGQWSSVYVGSGGNQTLNTPILTIGDPPLLCAQGSSEGNFGTLLLTHAGYTGWDNIGAANVALGLTNSLAIYPAGGPADGTCSSAQPQTVLWNTDGTNCVDTDTGMSSSVASGGFLGLGSSAIGGNQYLLYPNGKTKCGAGGTQDTSVVAGKLVNNDPLTCFFLSSSTHVGDVDTNPNLPGGYQGPAPLISPSIYDSPRFAYVPVLNVQPANGGSTKYQIVDFRACFITNQPASAMLGDQATGNNGITLTSNGNAVQSVQVVFLNPNALPSPPVKNGTINYIGSGVKIPLLVTAHGRWPPRR